MGGARVKGEGRRSLAFAFPSSGPSTAPPSASAGRNPKSGASGLFALCTLDGESLGSAMAVQGGQWCARGLRRVLPPAWPPLPAGTLKLTEEADKLLWSVQVDHQLFALEKLDVTVSGGPWAPFSLLRRLRLSLKAP